MKACLVHISKTVSNFMLSKVEIAMQGTLHGLSLCNGMTADLIGIAQIINKPSHEVALFFYGTDGKRAVPLTTQVSLEHVLSTAVFLRTGKE